MPFCSRKCRYCAFVSRHPRTEDFQRYYRALTNELQTLANCQLNRHELTSIYFGGGTPSLLPAEMLCQILTQIKSLFGVDDNCEITLEINPASVNENDLALLFNKGNFNRASVGYQTGNPKLLELLGRDHRPEDFERTIVQLVNSGCSNISIDFMFGLPQQSLDDLRDSVSEISQYPVQHIAFYSLMLEPQTVFYRRYRERPELLPTDEEERAMYRYLIASLKERGFAHYELSNVAQPGYASRHNLLYWQARQYLAAGPAAAGYAYGWRWNNPANIDHWLNYWDRNSLTYNTDFDLLHSASLPAGIQLGSTAICKNAESELALNFGKALQNLNPKAETELITGTDSLHEAMWLGLRLVEGVDLREITSRYQVEALAYFAEPIERLSCEGLLEIHDDHLRLTERGQDLANYVSCEFV